MLFDERGKRTSASVDVKKQKTLYFSSPSGHSQNAPLISSNKCTPEQHESEREREGEKIIFLLSFNFDLVYADGTRLFAE
jgi:hypothetical protein